MIKITNLFLLALSLTIAGGSMAAGKPNIILFLVDDMGLMDTSVPMLADAEGNPEKHPLNEWYRTPNMERLAAQGVRFSKFYAQSVCSPTRVSIMTGQNSARHRVTQFISPDRRNSGPADWRWEGLTENDVTLPRLLSQAGYRTIHSGKAHFGPVGVPGEDPITVGFDINIAGCAYGQPGSYNGEDGYGNLNPKRKKRAVPGLEKYHKTDTFLSEAITIEAKAAIDASLAEKKPFFLYMAHYAVHSPFQADPRFAENYANSDKAKNAKAYATLVEGIDKSLGDLLDHVIEKEIAENTVIFFVGDNGSDAPLGDAHSYTSSAPLRGKKATCYEGGMRVPFIAAWAKPGEANSQPIKTNSMHSSQIGTVMDFFPTILELAEIEKPENHPVDGSSLWTQLSGEDNPQRTDHFLCHFPHSHRSSHFTSLRKDKWKLIYRYPHSGKKKNKRPQTHELYNLEADPYETNNLIDSEPERLKAMIQYMAKQLEAENAQYLVDGEGNLLKPVVP